MEKISEIFRRFTWDFAEPYVWMQSSIGVSDFSVVKYSVCSSQQTVKFKEKEDISIIENQCLNRLITMDLQRLD